MSINYYCYLFLCAHSCVLYARIEMNIKTILSFAHINFRFFRIDFFYFSRLIMKVENCVEKSPRSFISKQSFRIKMSSKYRSIINGGGP